MLPPDSLCGLWVRVANHLFRAIVKVAQFRKTAFDRSLVQAELAVLLKSVGDIRVHTAELSDSLEKQGLHLAAEK